MRPQALGPGQKAAAERVVLAVLPGLLALLAAAALVVRAERAETERLLLHTVVVAVVATAAAVLVVVHPPSLVELAARTLALAVRALVVTAQQQPVLQGQTAAAAVGEAAL